MENNLNIEDLFKNALGNAEATPPAGAWEAIQAKMGVTTTAAATASAAGLGIAKIAAIVITALGVGLGAGYLAFKGNNKPSDAHTPRQENTANAEETLSENAPVNLPKDIKITEVSSVNKADKTVSIVEVKKGTETKKILVEIHHSSTQNSNSSIVNQWLSPSKDKINRQEIMQRIVNELEKEDNDTKETQQSKDNNIVVQTIENDEVMAGIKTAAGENLTYSFSNMTEAGSYEWSFSDGTTSTEASLTHTFSAPGNYVVTLKVYNKAGKMFKDQVFLEVKSQEEEVAQETSSIKKTNVFTPNGDGSNDEFYLSGKNIESFNMTIYDQNNRVVFSCNDINQHWNGNDRSGNPLPNGKYLCAFKAVGKDKKPHEGNYYITLSGR